MEYKVHSVEVLNLFLFRSSAYFEFILLVASFVYVVHILYILLCNENILYSICNNICVVLVSDSNRNKYYVI